MSSPSRRPPRVAASRRRPRTFRPSVQELEDRRVPAAPVIDPLQVPLNIPAGKTLIVPITATDPAGGSVSYSIQSSNPNVTAQIHTGNTFLDVSVAGFGDMEFELFNDLTPQTAALIAGFVKSDFYDGLTFHRVAKGFVIQGGDPAGNGSGGPGFPFDDEFNPQAIFSGSGQLALANSGPDTNGSQFFITDGPQRFLDFDYTLFGQMVRGFDVLRAIENVPVESQDPTNPNAEISKPVTPVVITSARIVQDTTDAVFTLQSTGAAPDSTTLTVTATSSTGGTFTGTIQANVVADQFAPGVPVNDPPFLGPVADQVSTAGTPVTIHLTSTDLESDASKYAAVVEEGPSAATASPSPTDPSGFVIKPAVGFTGVVHVLLKVQEANPGSGGTSRFDTQVITVAFGDQALAAQPAAGAAFTEGAQANGVTLATFTDADTTSVPADFQVSLNWGDGTPPDTTSAQVTGSAGHFTVTAVAGTQAHPNHTYAEAGTYTVRVVVTDVHQGGAGADNGGATATVTVPVAVADALLSGGQGIAVTGTAGSPLNQVPVAAFADANANARAEEFAATIAWGDGTTSAGRVVAASGGGFQVLGSHVYAAPGQYPVGVSVTDVNTAGDSTAATLAVQTSAAVAAAPPTPVPPAPEPPVPPHGRHRHHRQHHPRHKKKHLASPKR